MTEQLPGEPRRAVPDSERNWAVGMHLLTLVALLTGGWLLNVLVPLVGMLWKVGDTGFLAEHSREQLNFQISLIVYSIVAVVLAFLTLGLGLLVILPLAIVIALVAIFVIIRAALAASRGDQYRFPLTMRFVR